MKKMTINPFKNTIDIKGFDFIGDCEMELDDFKQLCFKNNWEGTLHKVINAESQILPMFEAAIKSYVEIKKANSADKKTRPPIQALGHRKEK